MATLECLKGNPPSCLRKSLQEWPCAREVLKICIQYFQFYFSGNNGFRDIVDGFNYFCSQNLPTFEKKKTLFPPLLLFHLLAEMSLLQRVSPLTVG